MKKLVLIPALLFFTLAHAQEKKSEVLVTDLTKIQQVQNVSLSNDGKTGVYTVRAVVPGDSAFEYKYETQIWMVKPGTSAPPVAMTTRENSSQPALSPDGSKIAFTRAVKGRAQVFILNTSGGEAWQLTSMRNGAGSPQWSPDGKSILFSSQISYDALQQDSVLNAGNVIPAWPLEKPGISNADLAPRKGVKPDPNGNMEEVRQYLAANERANKADVYNRLNFITEADLDPGMNFNQFYIINAEAGSKPVPVTSGFFRFNSARFVPGQNSILLSMVYDTLNNPDRALIGEIYIVNPDGKNLKRLMGSAEHSYVNAQVSPSGKWITYFTAKPQEVRVPKFYIKPFAAGENEAVEIKMDRNVGNITFSGDEQYVYFTSTQGGGSVLYRYHIARKNLEKLSADDEGISSYDLQNNVLLYAKTAVKNPSELFVADATGRNEKQLTNLNAWVANRKLSIPEKHSFTNEKGLEVDYWVMKPVDYTPGKKYPLLLEIHGGPSAMWGPGEFGMWHEYQYFTGKGYGVVYSNPRGSGGYGEEFLRANRNDWGAGPMRDVLTALDKTVAEGWADTAKLLVTGGSYAGYLVAYIIAHDQRFAAACAQRGVYDLATFFGEGNAWRLIPNYFDGYPWETKTQEVLFRESPINYVENIKTPFIIFHGDKDRRTGFVQSEMLYKSLKVLDRPVEYVRHPNATHEITRSGDNRQRIDQMLRTWEFFERFIQD